MNYVFKFCLLALICAIVQRAETKPWLFGFPVWNFEKTSNGAISTVYFPAPKTKTISWSWNFPKYTITKDAAHDEADEEPSTPHATTTTTSTEAPSTAKPQVFEFKLDTSAIAKSKQEFFNAAADISRSAMDLFWQKKQLKNDLLQQALNKKGSVNIEITKS